MTIALPVRELLLAAAGRIAARLCDAAIWNGGGECSWIHAGLVTEDGKTFSQTGPMGPTLYNGTAGVALFLAEIARLTGSGRFAQTALGAAQHACRAASPESLTLYSGQTGLLFSLLRIGECLDEPGLRHQADDLLDVLLDRLRQPEAVPQLDVMAGSAGVVLGLLNIHRRRRDPPVLAAAISQGWHLCEKADWTEEYCNWLRDSKREEHGSAPLSGFSHGSSGIGAALLALAAATGEEDFLLTGRGGFAYDDTLFRDAQSLWIDRRSQDPDGRNVAEAWCHGAAGIALARIIAAQSDPAERGRHDHYGAIAAQGTGRNLKDYWMLPGGNCCLCHGALGACDVLVTAERHGLGADLAEMARRAAVELVRRHDGAGAWPSNPNFAGMHLGLLMGLAGMGHGLLRVAYPDEVESVLMIH